jgi:stage II sporulation SpoAA-like protein
LPPAQWDDLQIGINRIPDWERVAVVTDIDWIRQSVKALRFLFGSEIRVFTTSEAGDGLAWIKSP